MHGRTISFPILELVRGQRVRGLSVSVSEGLDEVSASWEAPWGSRLVTLLEWSAVDPAEAQESDWQQFDDFPAAGTTASATGVSVTPESQVWVRARHALAHSGGPLGRYTYATVTSGASPAAPAVTGLAGTAAYDAGSASYLVTQTWDDVAGMAPGDSYELEQYDGGLWNACGTVAGNVLVNTGNYGSPPTFPFRIRAVRSGVPGPWAYIPGCPASFAVVATSVGGHSVSWASAVPVPGDGSTIPGTNYLICGQTGDLPIPLNVGVGDPTQSSTATARVTDSLGRVSLEVQIAVLAAPQGCSGADNGDGTTTFTWTPGPGGGIVASIRQASDNSEVGTNFAADGTARPSVSMGGVDCYIQFLGADGTPGLQSATFRVTFSMLTIGTLTQTSFDPDTSTWIGSVSPAASGGAPPYTYTAYVNNSPFGVSDLSNINVTAAPGDSIFVRVTDGETPDPQTADTNTVTAG